MKHPIHSVRNPFFVFWFLGAFLLCFALWPRTIYRRRKGPKFMDKPRTLADEYDWTAA